MQNLRESGACNLAHWMLRCSFTERTPGWLLDAEMQLHRVYPWVIPGCWDAASQRVPWVTPGLLTEEHFYSWDLLHIVSKLISSPSRSRKLTNLLFLPISLVSNKAPKCPRPGLTPHDLGCLTTQLLLISAPDVQFGGHRNTLLPILHLKLFWYLSRE